MATNRQSIIRGPGTVTFDSVKFFDQSGITAEVDSATQDIGSSISGKLDTIKTDQIGKISLTPVGNLSNEILAIFYPEYVRTPVIGQSIFGATDKELVISSKAGTQVKFTAAALTKCPELYLSPVKTAFGGVEFTALLPNGCLADDETKKLYTVAAAQYADGEAPRTGLSGHHYTATFGTISIPDTVDGWTVGVEAQLNAVTTDSQGTIDYTLGGVTVTARCTPLGLKEDEIFGMLPVLKGRGASMSGTSDLVIASPGGLTVTLKNAALVTGPLNWGTTTLRAGELGFTANLDTANGALFSIALAGTASA